MPSGRRESGRRDARDQLLIRRSGARQRRDRITMTTSDCAKAIIDPFLRIILCAVGLYIILIDMHIAVFYIAIILTSYLLVSVYFASLRRKCWNAFVKSGKFLSGYLVLYFVVDLLIISPLFICVIYLYIN